MATKALSLKAGAAHAAAERDSQQAAGVSW
jgi:hypothetical protein